MKLGEFIKGYRNEHDLSQRQFATLCGVSNGYVSMIEDGKNPKTGEPIVPNIATLKKISDAMGISLHELLTSVDNLSIELSAIVPSAPAQPELNEGEKKWMELYYKIPKETREIFISAFEASDSFSKEKQSLVFQSLREFLENQQ